MERRLHLGAAQTELLRDLQTGRPDRNEPVVYIVDDDEGMQTSLAWLLASARISTRCFGSGHAFLEEFDPEQPCCIIIDVRMPGMDGLELFDIIQEQQLGWPVIFVTANGQLAMAVNAIRAGAFHFIEKPYDPGEMLDLVKAALQAADDGHSQALGSQTFFDRFNALTPRECEILREVVSGKQSKNIAFDLGISERTVDVHRTNIRRKMQLSSVAALVNLVLRYKPDWRA